MKNHSLVLFIVFMFLGTLTHHIIKKENKKLKHRDASN